MSVSFYNQQAQNFARDTLNVDMTSIYCEFLPLLAPGSLIIDAGCGAGRDSRYFLSQGFNVAAFDASLELIKIATEVTGLPVKCSTFEEYQTTTGADAIWACASLLHVPFQQQKATFKHLAKALKPGGVFYCSYKYGNKDSSKDGRQFTNADEERLNSFVKDTVLQIKKCWTTVDARPGRDDEKWLNAILERTA